MQASQRKLLPLLTFSALSLIAHLALLCAISRVGTLQMSAPVPMEPITVRFAANTPAHAAASEKAVQDDNDDAETGAATEGAGSGEGAEAVGEAPDAAGTKVPGAGEEKVGHGQAPPQAQTGENQLVQPEAVPAAQRSGELFPAAVAEKLSYQIFLLGMPVGSAVLEARRDRGGVTVTWSVTSNPFASGFFRVADQAQTRLVGGGKYLISRVRQQEGSFVSDTGFTLCFPEKKVFWADRLHNRVSTQPIQEEDTTDIFFGFYYLRNRPLEVGQTVRLHLFDSNRTIEAPIEVVRKERIKLSLWKEVETLVVRPAFSTDTFFKGTTGMTIWLTDDRYRVPVRLETTMPLGAVRAELVSAEVERPEKGEETKEKELKAFHAD